MKVIACYKVVPYEQSISVNADRSLNLDKAELMIGQYDLNAVEAGAQLVEKNGGELTALTVGAAEVDNSKLRKSVLSRGPANCVTVNDPSLSQADSTRTSAALAEAVGSIGDFDLILCGEGSSDLYSQQVGVQLGERLGVPAVNGVISIESGDGFVTVQRSADGEVETLEVKLPAVLSVSSGINRARVPSMKEILAAGKKPVRAMTGEELRLPGESATSTVSILAPKHAERSCRIFTGDSAETLAEFVAAVNAELK